MDIAPQVDLLDPHVRYRLIAVSTYSGIQKAYIKDLLAEKASLIKAGEKIGDCKLVSISVEQKSVRLKPDDGEEFSLGLYRPAKR